MKSKSWKMSKIVQFSYLELPIIKIFKQPSQFCVGGRLIYLDFQSLDFSYTIFIAFFQFTKKRFKESMCSNKLF